MTNPTFSIVTPVLDPPAAAFLACIDSVLNQTETDWEWILADDGCTDAQIIRQLDELGRNPKIQVQRSELNAGISAATNAALDVATGTFVAFLDHDDVLVSSALQSVRQHIEAHDDVDMAYSDEAKLADDGTVYDWFEKPDWSPERLRGQNYCNHLSVLRRSVVAEVGGLRSEYDGAQDHDLVLRVSEIARRIVHVPEVLYLWRAAAGSTAATADAKPTASDAGVRAVEAHLARIGYPATVTCTFPGRYAPQRRPSTQPLVSIVMPTAATVRRVRGTPTCLVENAIESIVKKTTYDNYQVVVVHGASVDASVLQRIGASLGDRLQLVEWTGPFSFAAATNLGVVRSSGEVIVFMNDDTEVISPEWLDTLVAHLEEPDVGIVGPMLLLSDGRIQSAGHHYDPSPLHIGAGAPADDPGPFAMFTVAGERSGVTAACAAIRRSVLMDVGALSPVFASCYNDVDLGFKLLQRGMRIVWTPHVHVTHFESLSRDPIETPIEARELHRRWGHRMGPDPYARQLKEWWADGPMLPPVGWEATA